MSLVGKTFTVPDGKYKGAEFEVTRRRPRARRLVWECTQVGKRNPLILHATEEYVTAAIQGINIAAIQELTASELRAVKDHVTRTIERLNEKTGLGIYPKWGRSKRSSAYTDKGYILFGEKSLARRYYKGYTEYATIEHLIPGAAENPAGFLGVWYLVCHEYAHMYRFATTGRDGPTKRIWSSRYGRYIEKNIYHDDEFAAIMRDMMGLAPFMENEL